MNTNYAPAGIIDNGRGRRDHFLSSSRRTSRWSVPGPPPDGRRPSRSAGGRPPPTRNISSSMSVRINAVDSSVYLFSVNTISYICLTIVNLALVIAGIIVLVRHWGDEEVCDATFRKKWRWWALGLIARKVLITPAHLVRALPTSYKTTCFNQGSATFHMYEIVDATIMRVSVYMLYPA